MDPIFSSRRRLLSAAAGAVAVLPGAGRAVPHEHRPDGQAWSGAWTRELKAAVVRAMPESVTLARGAEYPFGAVLVSLRGGEVVAAAANSAEDGDTTAHAEMNLLREAAAKDLRLRDHAVVGTAEPCPMCAGALLWAGVPAVAFGTANARLTALGIPQINLPFEAVARRSTVGPRPAVGRGVRHDLTDPLYEELARRWREAGGAPTATA